MPGQFMNPPASDASIWSQCPRAPVSVTNVSFPLASAIYPVGDEKKERVMRLHISSAAPAALTLVGLVSALSAHASASEADPASAVRGSLGVPLDDLVLSSGAGTAVFLMNAGFALVFAAICIAVRRANSRKGKHIPFRASSSSPFAR